MKKINIIVFICIALIGGVVQFIIQNNQGKIVPKSEKNVYVYRSGKLLKKLNISKSGFYYFDGNSKGLTVEILNSAVRVKESQCPQKICVNTGFIRTPGASIICAPNGIVVQIGKPKKLDAETR